MGIKTLVGAWLGDDLEKNEAEIAGLIALCKQGVVDVAAVGNEVLYREDLEASTLVEYIERVKAEVSGVPVGYVDAYYEFTDHPEVSDACDVILANCYPYWEGCALDYSLMYMKQMYMEAKIAGKGKPVLITETGWPSSGQSIGGAQASFENSLKYFISAQRWSAAEDIPMFYFSSFDESWKIEKEGDVGASRGTYITFFFNLPTFIERREVEHRNIFSGRPTLSADEILQTILKRSLRTTDALTAARPTRFSD